MNWKVELTFEDGTVEYLYCISREEARIVARRYRAQIRAALAGEYSIGKMCKSAIVRPN